MTSIVTLTLSPTIDTSTHVDHVIPERKLRCDQPLTEPGGGGVNVARALRRFGAEPLAIFTAGGHTGERMIELVEAEDVDVRTIPIAEMTRENFTVREDASSLQYRFCMPGPEIRESEWQQILEAIESLEPAPDYMVVSGSLPPGLPDDSYAQIAHIANRRGVRMVLDTSGPPLRAALDAGLFLIKPNLAELAWLEGETWIEDDQHLRETAAKLTQNGRCEAVVVSLGAGGALVSTHEQVARIPAPSVRSESKVGAGDSMVAGIVLGLSRGWTMVEAASFGVAAGSAAVMTPGSDLCRRDDTERLYAQIVERPAPLAGIS